MRDLNKTNPTGFLSFDGEHRPGSRTQASTLPLQNLALAAVVIGCFNGAAQWLSIQTGFPFGRGHGMGGFGWSGEIAWRAGLVLGAVVSLISARGVAKLVLLRRRRSPRYGYWLLALNAVLGVLPLAGLDLLVTQGDWWWCWEDGVWQWQGIALPNSAGWLLMNILSLLLATPALIDKRPIRRPPGLRPLVVWFALNAACLAACVSRASDAAVAVLAAPVLVVTALAFRQHRLTIVDCDGPLGRQ